MRKQSFILPPDIKRRLPKILRRLGDLLKGNEISTNQGEVSPALRVVSTDIRFAKPSNYNRKIVKPTYRRELTGVPSVEFVFADKAQVKAVDLGIGLRLEGVGFKLAMTLEDEPRMYAGFGKKPYIAIADMEDLRGRVRMLFARALAKNYKGLETTLEVAPDLAVAYFEAVKADPDMQAVENGSDDMDVVEEVPAAMSAEGLIPDTWIAFFERTVGHAYVLATAQLPPLRIKIVSFVGSVVTLEAVEDFSSKRAGQRGDRFSVDLAMAPITLSVEKVFEAVMQAGLKGLYQVHGRTKIKSISMDSGSNSHPADPQPDFSHAPVMQTPSPVREVPTITNPTFESVTGMDIWKYTELVINKTVARITGVPVIPDVVRNLRGGEDKTPTSTTYRLESADLTRADGTVWAIPSTFKLTLDVSKGDIQLSDSESRVVDSISMTAPKRDIQESVSSKFRIGLSSWIASGAVKKSSLGDPAAFNQIFVRVGVDSLENAVRSSFKSYNIDNPPTLETKVTDNQIRVTVKAPAVVAPDGARLPSISATLGWNLNKAGYIHQIVLENGSVENIIPEKLDIKTFAQQTAFYTKAVGESLVARAYAKREMPSVPAPTPAIPAPRPLNVEMSDLNDMFPIPQFQKMTSYLEKLIIPTIHSAFLRAERVEGLTPRAWETIRDNILIEMKEGTGEKNYVVFAHISIPEIIFGIRLRPYPTGLTFTYISNNLLTVKVQAGQDVQTKTLEALEPYKFTLPLDPGSIGDYACEQFQIALRNQISEALDGSKITEINAKLGGGSTGMSPTPAPVPAPAPVEIPAPQAPKTPKAPKTPQAPALSAPDKKDALKKAKEVEAYLMSGKYADQEIVYSYYKKTEDNRVRTRKGRYGQDPYFKEDVTIYRAVDVTRVGSKVTLKFITNSSTYADTAITLDLSKLDFRASPELIVKKAASDLYLPLLKKRAESNLTPGDSIVIAGNMPAQEKWFLNSIADKLRQESQNTVPPPVIAWKRYMSSMGIAVTWGGKETFFYTNNSFKGHSAGRIIFVGRDTYQWEHKRPKFEGLNEPLPYTQEEIDEQMRSEYPAIIARAVEMVKKSPVGGAFNGSGPAPAQTVDKSDLISDVKSAIGRGTRLSYEDAETLEFEPSDRRRLDHHGNDGDGWDEESWVDDYAGELQFKVEEALKPYGGEEAFSVEVDDKGFVNIQIFRDRVIFASKNRTASLLRKALGTSGKGVKVAHNLYYRLTDKLEDKGIRYQESSKAGSKVLSFDGHVIVIAPDNRNWTLRLRGYREDMKNLDVDDLDYYL